MPAEPNLPDSLRYPIDHPALLAMQTALRSLFATHVQPELLRATFRGEYQQAIAVMRLHGAGGDVVEAYRNCVGAIVPEAEDRPVDDV